MRIRLLRKWWQIGIGLVLTTGCAKLSGDEWVQFDPYQGELSKADVSFKLQQYLIKDWSLQDYFELTDESFIIYASPEAKKEQKREYTLQLNGSLHRNLVKQTKPSTFQGLKVALDPGHFGGPYAFIEERFMRGFLQEGKKKVAVTFNEGALNYLTAKALQLLLEQEGAIVMMTRSGIGKGAYSVEFFDWLKQNPALWKGSAQLSALFRKEYNPLDLRARAALINQFAPDLTVIIHYNAHESGHFDNSVLVDQNYTMGFIPGAFGRAELTSKEARLAFMRLVTSNSVLSSEALTTSIVNALSQKLSIPLAEASAEIPYLEKACIQEKPGVFARNLVLTRLVIGPLCYGEALIQNNKTEFLRLATHDTYIDHMPASSVLQEVAQAYFDGIKTYLMQ